jgi:hypothetical protein
MAAGRTYTPIATQTLGSAAASVTFSSIPGTYTDLMLVLGDLKSGTSSNSITVRYNSDSETNYSYTIITGTGSAGQSARESNKTYSFFGGYNVGVDSTYPSVMVGHIMNYANTTTYKTGLSRYGIERAGGTGETQAIVNLWRSTAAITSVTVATYTGNWSIGSVFSLYGILAA